MLNALTRFLGTIPRIVMVLIVQVVKYIESCSVLGVMLYDFGESNFLNPFECIQKT